jgi:dUTP pyrophosphatase
VVNGPGLIDAGYRGEVQVVLVNLGEEPFAVVRGDRIAQLVVVPVVAQEFTVVDELPVSSRGVGGFGSTGT